MFSWFRQIAREGPRLQAADAEIATLTSSVHVLEDALDEVTGERDAARQSLQAAEAERVCEHCGLPLSCNAELRERIAGYAQMFEENIAQRDTAYAERDALRQRCQAVEGALETGMSLVREFLRRFHGDEFWDPDPKAQAWLREVVLLARPATPTEAGDE